MTKTSMKVAGIDTGKMYLDVAVVPGGPAFRVGNDAAGLRQLIERLAGLGVERAGIEASGGYERAVIEALQQAGVMAVRHQPVQVRLFARMRLRRAKNDRLDAETIAAFTAFMADGRAADTGLGDMADHLVYIEQLSEDIARLKTRLEQQHDLRLAAVIEADITTFTRRRAAERRRLEQALRQNVELRRRLDLLVSIPGIGLPTAMALVILMPELGQLNRGQAAALGGLCPFDRDSGQWHGQRHIAGGRTRLRKALYAAALPAAYRWNPQLVAFYRRLTTAGKTHKQALVACARKLLIFANIVLARGTPWHQI